MKRKTISALLVFILLASMVTRTLAVNYQDQKKDVQNKIENAEQQQEAVEKEKKTTLSEIADLEVSIAEYESDIRQLKADIEKLENKIEIKNKQIKEAEEDLENKKKLLEEKLVAIYEEGQISFLDVLLSAESIWDYISMGTRLQELTEDDNRQMDEVEAEMKKLEKTKNELKEEKSELDTAKKTADVKQKQLKIKKASKEDKVATLSEEEKKIQKQLDDYEAELNKIDEEIKKQAAKAQTIYSGSFAGTLGWPLSEYSHNYNVITSTFGSRNAPVAGASSNHRGIDIAVNVGTPVYASADGYVISVQSTSARGIFVLIKHADDLYTRYQHLSRAAVSEGQYVSRAQIIAYSGETGVGSGPHLHFEVLKTPYYMTEMNPLSCGLLEIPPLIYS